MNAHRDKQIAKGGDDSRQEAHNQRAIWGDHELSCCPHGHATCQSGVLDMHLSGETARKELVRRILSGVILNCNAFHETRYHVQLSFLLRHAGDGHRGENRGSESQVGVDGCPVLSVAVVSDG